MSTAGVSLVRNNIKIILLDLFLLVAIYFIPALTHLFSLPLYVIEPMRLALFTSILFSNKQNSMIIAVSLPLFSLITSGHPLLVKSLVITFELVMNVILFYFLFERGGNRFLSVFLSITISKILYYVVKFAVISFGMLSGGLVSTSIIAQVIVLLSISLVYSQIASYLDRRSN